MDSPYGLPVCVAYLWSENYPVIFAAGGCHTSPTIALTRALTEAAQSRLTAIAGTAATCPAMPPRSILRPCLRPRAQLLRRGRRPPATSPGRAAASSNRQGPWHSASRTSPDMSRWPWTCPPRAPPSSPYRSSVPVPAHESGGQRPDERPHHGQEARRAALRPIRRLPRRPGPYRSGLQPVRRGDG
ncbi:YcaO-like family protein [Streptomyces sp. C1-2]|uniref:YcaO-like family protein n=1 Tax=Streptomyces sp. C1-2 TaxID=2720022 RepID=UPI003211F508